MTIPAARSRLTISASRAARWAASFGDPAAVITPAMSTRSLTATGWPCSGPPAWPAAASASRRAASSLAWSARTVTKAPTRPSTASMRSSACSTSSTLDLTRSVPMP